jgi:hypothetical protein
MMQYTQQYTSAQNAKNVNTYAAPDCRASIVVNQSTINVGSPTQQRYFQQAFRSTCLRYWLRLTPDSASTPSTNSMHGCAWLVPGTSLNGTISSTRPRALNEMSDSVQQKHEEVPQQPVAQPQHAATHPGSAVPTTTWSQMVCCRAMWMYL